MSKNPRFGSGIVADGGRPQQTGKLDVHGIFTQFWAWSFPASRAWTLVVTIFDVPKKQTTLLVKIKRKGESQETTLASTDIIDLNESNGQTIQIDLGHSFKKEGDYEIICTLKNYSTKLSIPFRVRVKEWPEFTEKEIEVLNKNRQILPFRLSAQIKCRSCDHVYVFEECVIPDVAISGGALKFPDNGIFECENCGHSLKLKDIQGQLRATIKDTVSSFIKTTKHV